MVNQLDRPGQYQSDMRILVVDDEPFNLQALEIILKSSLRKLGHDPEIINHITDYALNGEEAMNLVRYS